MKSTILAVTAVAALAGAASADVVINIGGPFTYTAAGGVTVTSPALYGTLTGVIFHFDYSDSAQFSWASDIACTVDGSQWGGYDTFINGATIDEGGTGAPDNGTATSFTSAFLAIDTPVVFNGGTAVVGAGNGYSTGDCTLNNMTVTLVGVDLVPTPGAAALLGLGSLASFRRRRA